MRYAWVEADQIVRRLGGYGPVSMTVIFEVTKTNLPLVLKQKAYGPGKPPPDVTVYSKFPQDIRMTRTVDAGEIDQATVDSLDRELSRAGGWIRNEPG